MLTRACVVRSAVSSAAASFCLQWEHERAIEAARAEREAREEAERQERERQEAAAEAEAVQRRVLLARLAITSQLQNSLPSVGPTSLPPGMAGTGKVSQPRKGGQSTQRQSCHGRPVPGAH
jgi:uncharacterized protein with von Willebrand factor type A (vWA) domain